MKTSKILSCVALTAMFFVACSDDVSEQSNDNIRDQINAEHGSNNNNGDDDDAGITTPDVDECEPGEVLSCAGGEAIFVCNDEGTGGEAQNCPADAPTCFEGACTDQVCEPGKWECDGESSRRRCNADGSGWEEPVACMNDDLCTNGTCGETCELGAKMTSSYFGCEYWTVYLDQYDDPFTNIDDASFGLVVSNPNDEPATVQFQVYDLETEFDVADPVIPAGESRVFSLPRAELNGTGISRLGIFVRSSLPVTAHQFNPTNNENVASNDASLLLPVSVLGTRYYVMNWPSQILLNIIPGQEVESQYSYVTIVAASPGTTNVVINSKADIVGGEDIPEFPAGVGRNFEIQFGDVLNLRAGSDSPTSDANDLTGSLIQADQPVAVFAGHEQAVVGYDSDRESCCADHLEQQLWPVENLGQHYIAAFSPGRTQTKDHWRILAGEDGVTVQTDPPQPEANGVSLDAGEFVTFYSDEDFEINANGKIMVGQILTSQQQTAEVTGDPAFVLGVPVERYRDEYLVLVPEDYSQNFITIIRPAGAEVRLDDAPVANSEFTPIGSGEYETAAIARDSGAYRLDGDQPFGVTVYGLDSAVSYAYPGGLDVVGSEQ